MVSRVRCKLSCYDVLFVKLFNCSNKNYSGVFFFLTNNISCVDKMIYLILEKYINVKGTILIPLNHT